ncbi:multidrug resistance protein [Phenylobacterium zucineum HLK1]|uniref:Multidrug resistance protein n=1 Tax=Phenylobacterium zucineum (strain HLK1) TaxID=450851 RepID=B4RHL0_PHEZH|nr:tetracycline resistance MFS efflux pump [Phenylobacterium zucineum]ACG77470.1 multidrug resistance protein [Phenylobacterium zucineum HLK1]
MTQPPEPTQAPAPPPAPRGALPVMLLLVFLSLIGFGVVIPLLPFFAIVFEAKAWQVTLLFSVFSAGQFLGELTWGRLSDRIGRRPVLLMTIVASALGYVALAFAPNIWFAVAARAVAGFFSGNMSAIQGYIVDVSPPERLAGRLGLVGSAFGVGFVVGPALGGLLARPELGAAGFRPPLLVAAGLCLVAVAGLLIFVRDHRRVAPAAASAAARVRRNPLAGLREVAGHPVLALVFATIFFGFFSSAGLWSVLGLWMDARFAWGPREVGFVMALTGVAAALTQGILSGAMVRRIGAGATISIGFVVSAIATVAMAGAPFGWLAAILLLASVTGHAAWQPAAMSIASRSAGADRQGAVLGAATASGSLSRVLAPLISGPLFSGIGPWAPVALSGLVMLPAAWLGWRAARALRTWIETGPQRV